MRRRQIWNRRSYKGVGAAPKAGSNTAEQTNAQTPQKTPTELYEERFGVKPHGRMKESTILERLKDGKP